MYNIQKIIFFSKKVMNLKIMKDVALMGMGAGAVLAYQKYNKQVMDKMNKIINKANEKLEDMI